MSERDTTADEGPRRLSAASRRVVKLLGLALVVHLFVIPQIGGARRALSVVGGIDPLLIVLAVLCEAAALLAYAWLTRQLLPAADRPGIGVLFGAVLASTGVNHVVPGGAAATAAMNFRLLGRAGVPRESLGFALGAQAIGSAVVLNGLLWLALVISIPTSGFHPVYATAAGVGAVVIAALGLAVISMRRGSVAFADRIAAIVGRVPRVDADRVRSSMLAVASQLDLLAQDRRRLVTVIMLAAANWLFDAAALWVALSAFGPLPGLDGLMVAYGLAFVLAAVPISPGGLGVVEAVLIPTLVAFGAPAAETSIGVVAYRLVSFWAPIPIGALAYVLVSRSVDDDRQPLGFRGEVNERLPPGRGST